MSSITFVPVAPEVDLAWVTNLNRPDAGVIVVDLPPSAGNLAVIANGALTALGKDDHTAAVANDGVEASRQFTTWALTDEITDLVVFPAQWLTQRAARDLITFASAVDLRLWLVAYQPTKPSLRRVLDQWDYTTIDVSAFQAHWASLPAAPRVKPSAKVHDTFPRVPAAHGITFRADARRRLTAKQFKVVDDLYVRVARTAHESLAVPGVNNEKVLRLVRNTLEPLAGPERVVVAVRALQAIGLRHGWLIDVDEHSLRAWAELEPRTANRPDEDWDRLDLFRRTDLGAVCALLAHGVSQSECTRLNVGDPQRDGTTVTFVNDHAETTDVDLGDRAARYLRAHIAYRRLCGAADTDPLFNSRGREGCRVRHIGMLAGIAVNEAGFEAAPVAQAPVERRTPFQWASYVGVGVRKIVGDKINASR